MANKYTVTIEGTITSDEEQDAVYAKILAAVKTVGSNCLVQHITMNQWVDQYNSKAQVFNEDGTPYIAPETAETQTA